MKISKVLSSRNWVAVNLPLAKHLGLNAAFLFSHLCGLFEYYEAMGQLVDKDGEMYFYATIDTIAQNTPLTRTEQATAIQILKNAGLIIQANLGNPCKRHFSIPLSAEKALGDIFEFAGNLQTSLQETYKQVCGKPANQFAGKMQTSLQVSRNNINKELDKGIISFSNEKDNNEKSKDFSYTANAEEKKAAPEIKQPTSEPNDQTAAAGKKEKSSAKKEKAAEAELFQSEPADKKRFVPPTVDEVAAYCVERGNKINPANFVDFYISKGWYVGKNKMKDWKATVRTWERNQQPNNQNQNFSNNNPKIEITNEAARNYVERTYDRTY